MNLSKLFEIQKVLDDRIMDEHPELKGQDNLDWKVLALQVELGECANEWRGFKKWSHDQEPRIESNEGYQCNECEGTGLETGDPDDGGCLNPFCCDGTIYKNPLLTEYVDCLHFILSIGNEISLGLDEHHYYPMDSPLNNSLVDKFTSLITDVESLLEPNKKSNFIMITNRFLYLGEALGFTWDQIEQEYLRKNEINHIRQQNGY